MSKIAPVMMPQMGESLAEGTLVRWLKQVGDTIAPDEPLFEISTDKVDTDVPSPVAGRLQQQLVGEGQTVAVGVVVALISTEGVEETAAAPPAPPPAATPPEEPAGHFKSSHAAQLVSFRHGRPAESVPASQQSAQRAAVTCRPPTPPRSNEDATSSASDPASRTWSPAVLDAARRANMALGSLTAIVGSGRAGRVTKRDVQRFLESGKTEAETTSAPRHPPSSVPEPPAEYVYRPTVDDRIEQMSPVRRRIADHMVWSMRLSPHATAFSECDMSAAAALIARDHARDTEAASLTYTVLVAEAALAGLREFPVLNASVVGDSIVYKPAVNLGIAVALENPDELIVPVIRNANELNRIGLARAIADLAVRARQRRLTSDDVRGGTFTLTNPGVFGGTGGTPILHQPQVAILGLAAVIKRPVVVNDAIAIRPIMAMSLTIDHRATDGMVAFRFLERVRQWLENVHE